MSHGKSVAAEFFPELGGMESLAIDDVQPASGVVMLQDSCLEAAESFTSAIRSFPKLESCGRVTMSCWELKCVPCATSSRAWPPLDW